MGEGGGGKEGRKVRAAGVGYFGWPNPGHGPVLVGHGPEHRSGTALSTGSERVGRGWRKCREMPRAEILRAAFDSAGASESTGHFSAYAGMLRRRMPPLHPPPVFGSSAAGLRHAFA